MENGFFESVLVLLAIAVAVVVLFRHLHLPLILGYLVVGILVGPYALAWIPDTENTRALAEFGVVFLLFTVGLDFSLPRLMSMKTALLGLGGAQVALSVAMTAVIGVLIGMPVEGAVVVGGIVAMSSTAIVVKQLTEQLERHVPHGRAAVAILLFQDVAVVPFMILIASLANESGPSLATSLLWALLKGMGALLVILGLGRWLLRPLFHAVARTRSMELFTLAALLVTLTAAWVTDYMGLSPALGAFLAGMMLGETEFRHQLESEIRPFRDVLLGLFFITIGMLLDLPNLPVVWNWVLFLLAALLIFKTLLIAVLCRLVGSDMATALRTGLLLAQGGEFGFALLTLALDGHLLPPDYGQVILAALVLSMAMSPVLIRFNRTIADFLVPQTVQRNRQAAKDIVAHTAKGLEGHIIICGYGRVGQNVARLLEQEGFQFVALDLDPVRVQNARLAGEHVSFGDATQLEILEAAELANASALLVCIDDVTSAIKILQQVRQSYKNIPILVRARDDVHLERLQEHGATEVIPETLEASLMIATHLLLLMKVPVSRVLRNVRSMRSDRYALLRRIFPGQDIAATHWEGGSEHLRVIALPEGCHALGRTLAELGLESENVMVTAIQRSGIRGLYPEPDTRLRTDDVLVIYGTPAELERAEQLLLTGIS